MNVIKSENQLLKRHIKDLTCKSVNFSNQNTKNEFVQVNDLLSESDESTETQLNNNFNNYFYSYSKR